jgi:hypothetical protein
MMIEIFSIPIAAKIDQILNARIKLINNCKLYVLCCIEYFVTKNFKCKECGLLYPTQDDLDLHFKDIHKE